MNGQMLNYLPGEGVLRIREFCGLNHEFQVAELDFPPLPETVRQCGWLAPDGRRFPMQRSQQNPRRGFLAVAIAPHEQLDLKLDSAAAAVDDPVRLTLRETEYLLENRQLSLRIPAGRQWTAPLPCSVPGPVAGIRRSGGKWFGTTYFDTLLPIRETAVTVREEGPVRTVVEYRALLADGRESRTAITLDAGQCFALIDEEFHFGESDQLVWLFDGVALPETGYFLDSTPAYQTRWLNYFLDTQLARLGPWSQQSQLGLSDGFGFALPGENTRFGAVALQGGRWRGNRLNSLDAWMRRLRKGDRLTRRLVPAETKADAVPVPPAEQIPARDRSECTPALCWEAWLGDGRRRWALAACDAETFTPKAGDDLTRQEPPLDHFISAGSAAEFQKQQGLLRKLHIQRGLLPLQELLGMTFDALPAPGSCWSFDGSADFLRGHLAPDAPADLHSAAFLREMREFLRVRLESFWYGGGAANTNPVSSRRVAPYTFLLEEAAAAGEIQPEEMRLTRARILALAKLMSLPDYYCGESAMRPADDPDALNVPLMGMANQNFYTDVINLSGTAGAIYPDHPEAAKWRGEFIRLFSRQLDIHCYQSGVWEESHTYFQHVLLTVLPLMLMLRDRGEHDFFADTRFRKMLRAAAAQLTPRDRLTGNFRHLVAFGDNEGSIEPYRILWRHFATAAAPHDRELAAQLNRMARECGGTPDETLPETPLPWENEYLPGLGVFFRGQLENAETLLALRTGSAWAHHHDDDGSFQLFAFGRMLIGDAGFGGRTAGREKFSDDGHSRWTLPGQQIHNYHWRCTRGWPVRLELDAPQPEAIVFTPANFTLAEGRALPFQQQLRHFRKVVRLAPGAFLIADANEQPAESCYHFHFGSTRLRFDTDGAAEADYGDNVRLRLTPLSSGLVVERLADTAGCAPGDAMTTTHVRYTVPAAVRSAAFLIRFGTGPEIEQPFPLPAGACDIQIS